MGLAAKLAHVGIPAKRQHAFFLRGLHHGGRIGVLHQHVTALRNQRQGGFAFLARIKPGIHPDGAGGDGRVDAAGAQGEGVDVADHFRDGDGRHHAQLVALAHLAGHHAQHVGAFIGAHVVHAQVGAGLVAGGVHEDGVGEGFGHFHHLVHVAKRGAEHHFMAFLRQVAEYPLGVGGFWYVFDKGGGHFAARLRFQRLAAHIVGVGPAVVASRADINKAGLDRVSGVGRAQAGNSHRQRDGQGFQTGQQHGVFLS